MRRALCAAHLHVLYDARARPRRLLRRPRSAAGRSSRAALSLAHAARASASAFALSARRGGLYLLGNYARYLRPEAAQDEQRLLLPRREHWPRELGEYRRH